MYTHSVGQHILSDLCIAHLNRDDFEGYVELPNVVKGVRVGQVDAVLRGPLADLDEVCRLQLEDVQLDARPPSLAELYLAGQPCQLHLMISKHLNMHPSFTVAKFYCYC